MSRGQGHSGRRRLRRLAVWADVCVCALLAAAWLLSCVWAATLTHYGTQWSSSIEVGWGVLYAYVVPADSPIAFQPVLPEGLVVERIDTIERRLALRGFDVTSARDRDYYGFVWPKATAPRNATVHVWARLPLWMPLLAVAVLTGILHVWRPRPPPGHCRRCGYDLTGNTSGRCPECGAGVTPGG